MKKNSFLIDSYAPKKFMFPGAQFSKGNKLFFMENKNILWKLNIFFFFLKIHVIYIFY